MARRYGRNQKRRHRERISELEHALLIATFERNKARGERDEHARRHRDILITIERLSPHSVLLSIKRTSLLVDDLRMGFRCDDGPRIPVGFLTELDKGHIDGFTRSSFQVSMGTIRTWVETLIRDHEVKKLVHVEARDSGGKWVHTVSWDAMDRFGDFADLQAYVCETIIGSMSEDRKKRV